MIKKAGILVILIFVLGTSSTVSGLILVVGDGTTFTDPGDEVNIDINTTFWIGICDYGGTMYSATIWILANIEPAEWTGNTAVYSPPAISTAPGWTHSFHVGEELWHVDLSDPDSTEIPFPGVGCAIEFRALSEGDFWIVLNPTPVLPEDKLLVNIVPEPATVLFLALGGLALVRLGRGRRANKNR